MWAEIYLHAKDDLPQPVAPAIEKRMQTTDLQRAVKETIWAEEDTGSMHIVAADHSVTLTWLLFFPDVKTLRAHVESAVDKSDLRQLRKCAEEVATRLTEFLSHNANRATSLKIQIYAENNHLQTGERLSWSRRFRESLKND